jgi:hypothetical protein
MYYVYGTAHHRQVQTQALSGSRVLGLSDGAVNDHTRLKPAKLCACCCREIYFSTTRCLDRVACHMHTAAMFIPLCDCSHF